MGLEWYLQDASDLLHDQSFLFSTRKQLTRWVNLSRTTAARRTGCVRRHVTGQSAFGASAQPNSFVPGGAQPGSLPGSVPATSLAFVTNAAVNSLQTIPGQERYPYQGFFNPYLQAAHAGCEGIIDVIDCSVNWGGAVRPTLAWMPWDNLQAYARAYATQVTSYPYYWSCFNDGQRGEIWMFPAPSTTGDIELDAICVPAYLYSDNDFDAIPEEMRQSIKFGAAALAYMAKKNYADAQIMDAVFSNSLGVGVAARDGGKTPSYYWRPY